MRITCKDTSSQINLFAVWAVSLSQKVFRKNTAGLGKAVMRKSLLLLSYGILRANRFPSRVIYVHRILEEDSKMFNAAQRSIILFKIDNPCAIRTSECLRIYTFVKMYYCLNIYIT